MSTRLSSAAQAALLGLALAVPAMPAAAQSFAVTNATIVTGDGSEPVAGATVVVRGGRVVAAGPGVAAPADLESIDGTGKWVTPGLVAAVTELGLWDVSGVQDSNDASARSSPFSAALDIAPAINPASQHIAISRAAGITRAVVAPSAASSIFAGQGAVIDLADDADPIVRRRAFQYVEMGETGARLAGGSRVAAHALLRNALREALDYGRGEAIAGAGTRGREPARVTDPQVVDNRMVPATTERASDVLLTRFDAAALVPVVRGEQPLYVHVERAADIRAALALPREFPRLKLVLVGASEGWLAAQEIAAAGVPVIANGLTDLPSSFEQIGSTQSNIGRMVAAGVKVAINAAAMEQPRYLPQFAGNLVALTRMPRASGLSWGQAFAAISSVPAEIAGLASGTGTLRAGAPGDVVIWSGDPLEAGSTPEMVFIDGVDQPLDNHQTRLRERYRTLDESRLPKAYDW